MAELLAEPYLAPSATSRRRQPVFVGLAMAATATLLAGLVSVAALSSSAANSPTDAVQSFVTGAAAADANAVLAALDPAERDSVRPGLTALVDDLKKLGILDSKADVMSGLSGVTAKVSDLKLGAPQALTVGGPGGAQLSTVQITGGSVHLTVDPASLPLGALVKGLLAKNLKPVDVTQPLAVQSADHPIVTVNRGGTWYVSLSYTAAEAARRGAGQALPTTRVPAVGATTPDGVMQTLVQAGTAGDVRRIIELTDPTEMGALHDYASLFLDKVSAHPGAVHVTKLDLAPDTKSIDGGTLVTIRDFQASIPGGGTVSLTPAGCIQIHGAGLPAMAPQCPKGADVAGSLAIVAIKNGNSWYLSPARTMLADLGHLVATVNLADLAKGGGGLSPLFGGIFGFGAMNHRSSSCAMKVPPVPTGASAGAPIGDMLSGCAGAVHGIPVGRLCRGMSSTPTTVCVEPNKK